MRITLIALAVILSIASRASAEGQGTPPPPGPTAQATPLPYDHATSMAPIQPQPSSPVVLGDRVQMTTPNRKLLWASSIAFGAAYVPAVLVAATSSNSADRYLFIPIAGPWIDLAMRSCTAPAGVQCPNATWNGIGLFVDGIVQVMGAIGTGLAFKIPESTTIPARPAAFPGGGFGVMVTLFSPDRRGAEKW